MGSEGEMHQGPIDFAPSVPGIRLVPKAGSAVQASIPTERGKPALSTALLVFPLKSSEYFARHWPMFQPWIEYHRPHSSFQYSICPKTVQGE